MTGTPLTSERLEQFLDAAYLAGQHRASIVPARAAALDSFADLLGRVADWEARFDKCADHLDAALARVDALEAALLRYGKHRPLCIWSQPVVMWHGDKPLCSCGFEAALRAGSPRGEEIAGAQAPHARVIPDVAPSSPDGGTTGLDAAKHVEKHGEGMRDWTWDCGCPFLGKHGPDCALLASPDGAPEDMAE